MQCSACLAPYLKDINNTRTHTHVGLKFSIWFLLLIIWDLCRQVTTDDATSPNPKKYIKQQPKNLATVSIYVPMHVSRLVACCLWLLLLLLLLPLNFHFGNNSVCCQRQAFRSYSCLVFSWLSSDVSLEAPRQSSPRTSQQQEPKGVLFEYKIQKHTHT